MEIEPLPPSPPRIDTSEVKHVGSPSFPSPPLNFETDLLSSPKDEDDKSLDFSSIWVGCDSDSVGVGLRNIGNTCYLNSVLQCIIHTVPMVEKLRASDHHHSSCGGYDSDFCSLCALRKLVDSCMSNTGWPVAPYDFTNNLKNISPDFWLGGQQDAHEFLLCLLDTLHNCCLDPSSKDRSSSLDEDSLVKQVYGGRSISQLRCCECGHCSNTPEPLLDLSLEIADANTVTDALMSFTKVEKIEETKFTCDGCKSHVLMEKQTKIDQAPAVISLHLKRFRNDGQFINKIDKFVEYPLELDLRPFIRCPKDEEQTTYELYAVLVHRGGPSYGHYYCYVRSSPSTWHSMDDSMVKRVSEMSVLKEMAYILFYIKQGSSPWFSSLMESQNIKDTSPISVLDRRSGVLSPSSAEETSSSSLRVSPEKEEHGPCPDASPESATNSPERDQSSCTSHACDDISQQKRPQYTAASRLRAHHTHTKRPNSDQFVINIDNVFHDEALEDDKENKPTAQVNVGSNGNKEARATALEPTKYVPRMNEPFRRLMRGMPSSRRVCILACLPPEEKLVSKSSPLISKTHPLDKKRRRILSDSYSSYGQESHRKRQVTSSSSKMASSRCLSPGSIRRGLFEDDS